MKRKVGITVVLATILAIMCAGYVTAQTHTFKANVSANVDVLKPGEEVTVTLNVSDIDMGENGINVIEGTLSYDKNVFEEISKSDIKTLENWATTYNDENTSSNGKFISVNLSEGVQKDSSILSIKFKVKSDVTENAKTQIKFEEVTSNDGVDLISVGTKAVDLKVELEPKEEPIEEPKNEEKIDKLPQTYDNIVLEIVFAIIIVSITSIVILKKKRK